MKRIVIDVDPSLQEAVERRLRSEGDGAMTLDRLTEELLTQWLFQQHVRLEAEQDADSARSDDS